AQQDIDARVVSMPAWELFRKQDEAYKQSGLPDRVTARVSIEAAATFGWSGGGGHEGTAIGVGHVGAWAPCREESARFGITAGGESSPGMMHAGNGTVIVGLVHADKGLEG